MKLTKKNKSTLTVFLFSFICFFFVPSKIIQMILLSIVFTIGFCFLYAFSLKKNIQVERTIHKLKIASREKVELSLTIKNQSPFTAHICYIMDDAPYLLVFEHKNSDIVTLRPREIKKFKYTVSAQDRGLFYAGPVKMKICDPLALFELDLEVQNILEITVRPPRIKLITEAFPGLPQGSIKINNAIYEDITQRRSVREYMNGDEQRRINWRLTAKQGTLYTNVFENTFDTNFFVFLNLAEEDYDLHSRYYDTEKAIQIAASIVEKARELNQRVGFAAFGTGFPYIRPSKNSYDAILDILALIKMEPGKLDYDPYKYYKSLLPNGTIFFTVGPDEVRHYFSKVEANKEDITAENIGAYKHQYVGA